MIDDFGTENDTETEPEEVVSDPGLDALRAAQAETEAKENLQEEAARFDVADFLENARLPRTAIRLYARPDLDVEMQLIRADMVEALQRGDALAGQRLARRLEETQRAYMAQAIDIEIE
ncbi:hypothetical protein, partial [Actinotignum sanguinis]